MSNPLLASKFNTPHEAIPFDIIELSHYKPAFEEAIKSAQKEVDTIVENCDPPTFDNTIVRLATSGKELDLISSVFFNLNSAKTSDEMQALAQEVSPLLK